LPATGVPTTGDTAIINMPGAGTVYMDKTVTVANLTAIGVNLMGTGSLTVNGTLEAQYATFGPAGGITIASTGALNVDPVPNIPVYNTTTLACPMTLNGTANVTSNGIFSLNAGITCINNHLFTLEDGSQLVLASSGAAFVNNSLFYGGNALCSSGSSLFSNAPSSFVSINPNATFQFQGTLANSGYLEARSGSVLTINATTALHGGGALTGVGSILLTGNDTLDGTVMVSGQNVQFSGFALTLNGTLEIESSGIFNWVSGSLTGVGTNVTGTILVDASGNMRMNELGSMTLRNCLLTNAADGTLTWSNTGVVFMGYNAHIANNGNFLIVGDGELSPLPNGTPGYGSAAVYNYSLLQKKSGATNSATIINVPFHDSSLVRSRSGNLKFSAGGDMTSTWSVANGATIQMTGGNFSSLAATFSGLNGTNGLVTLASGATLAIPATNNSLTLAGSCIFQQLGGTILGTGYLDVTFESLFIWSGGVISLTNAEAIYISDSSVMNISGAGNPKTIVAGGVVNDGEINWVNDNAGGSVYAGDNVTFRNYGMFNIQCDAYLNDLAVTVHPVFTNKDIGVITKSALTGSSYFGFKTVNFGQIVAKSGTIDFSQFDDSNNQPFVYYFVGVSGAIIVLDGGSVRFDRATTVTEPIVGFGKISASSGVLTVTGPVESNGSGINLGVDVLNGGKFSLGDAPGIITFLGNNYTQMTNGTLVVPIRGTNAAAVDFGQLILSGYGQISLAGTLVAEITDGYAPPVGATFPFLTSFQRNGTFNNVILPQGMQLNYTSGGATLVITGAVPVQIISPAITNGQFQFGFNTISNRSYTVQYKDDLTSGNWTFLTNFTGNGSYWQAPPPLPLVPQRFFRVSNP